MKAPVVKTFLTVEDISQYIANMIYRALISSEPGSHFSIALSGGSTPRSVYSYLASLKDNPLDWQKIRLFWGDERCVEPGSPESNYGMVKDSLLDHIDIPESNVFRISGEKEPITEAARYADIVSVLLPHENNIPRFDLVMLGLGEDGHTASIFPGHTGLFHSEKLFEATENPYIGQKRITATGKLINQAAMVIFIVSGSSKAKTISGIIGKGGDLKKYPASLVQPERGELIWLLDEGAAGELERID